MKKYVNIEELNEEEKRTKKISYKRLINRICDNLILCNNIEDIDQGIYENIEIGEIDYNYEIYQFYIIDIDTYTLEKLKKLNCNDVIIAYSNILDNYILMVDHYGTSWDYVMTSIGYTEDIEKADI